MEITLYHGQERERVLDDDKQDTLVPQINIPTEAESSRRSSQCITVDRPSRHEECSTARNTSDQAPQKSPAM